jgi:hypothetical protein
LVGVSGELDQPGGDELGESLVTAGGEHQAVGRDDVFGECVAVHCRLVTGEEAFGHGGDQVGTARASSLAHFGPEGGHRLPEDGDDFAIPQVWQRGQAADQAFVPVGPTGDFRLPPRHAQQHRHQLRGKECGELIHHVDDPGTGQRPQCDVDEFPHPLVVRLDRCLCERRVGQLAKSGVFRRITEENLLADDFGDLGSLVEATSQQLRRLVCTGRGETSIVAEDELRFGIAGADPHLPDLIEEQRTDLRNRFDVLMRISNDFRTTQVVDAVTAAFIAALVHDPDIFMTSRCCSRPPAIAIVHDNDRTCDTAPGLATPPPLPPVTFPPKSSAARGV